MNDLDSHEFPVKGFVRRIASSFSNRSTTNLNRPHSFVKNCPLRSSFTSVSDIRKLIEANASSSTSSVSLTSSSTSYVPIAAARKKPSQPSRFQVEETLNGVNIQIKQPHLISVISRDGSQLSTPISRTSIRIYPLKTGRTRIGSDPGNDIVLKAGRSIEAEHCFIENRKAVDGGRMVALYPIGRFCAVEGVLIEEPYLITSGKSVLLFSGVRLAFN